MSKNTITVVFYEENREESILICEMIDVPRVGEFVTVLDKSGEVISVEWELVRGKKGSINTFAGVVINVMPASNASTRPASVVGMLGESDKSAGG